jgi:zinc protease
MKKLIFLLSFLLAGASALLAQMGKAYDMTINGVKVIVQPSGNDIVEILTVIKGGVQNYTADKAGIEALAMTALTECGTVKDDKNAFKDKLDKLSAEMGGSTGMDFASFRANFIKSDLDAVWPLYVDALTAPRFDPKEFNRIKQEWMTRIKAEESNPDVSIGNMARQTAFAGKDYAKDPNGTGATLGKLTAEATKAYYKSVFNRAHLTIVIVGDIDRSVLEAKVKSLLDRVPAGKPFVAKKTSFTPTANNFKPKEKELATNYIQGVASAPLPGTADYNAYVLAMRIFSTRHFVEIRTNNGLSYAPGAWFSGGLSPYSVVSVSTTEPNKYVIATRQLIDKIRRDGFTEDELRNIKTGYLTGVYYRQETNSAQAFSLAQNEVIHGNWKRAVTIKDDMKNVNLTDLNRVFSKYMTSLSWVFQGDPKKADEKLYKQKETPKPTDIKTF